MEASQLDHLSRRAGQEASSNSLGLGQREAEFAINSPCHHITMNLHYYARRNPQPDLDLLAAFSRQLDQPLQFSLIIKHNPAYPGLKGILQILNSLVVAVHVHLGRVRSPVPGNKNLPG